MIKQKIAIVIPVYKNEIDDAEHKSLTQCLRILSDYPIKIVAPITLDLSSYNLPNNIDIERFNDEYFKSINGYNKLMLSEKFYKRFIHFEYILIYQLDAFIFRDDLPYWCSLNYDYVGAPWKDILVDYQRGKIDYGVGNGGLSLRKVSSFIKVLNSWHFIYTFSFLYKRAYENNLSKNSIIPFLQAVYYYLFKNNFFYILNRYDRNEDMFWGIIVKEKHSWFKTPTIQEASNFSIEEHPKYFINFVSTHIPMGCHALEKNYDVFWKSKLNDSEKTS